MKIETSEITGFLTVTPDDGMVLTCFKDGDKPNEYTGAKKIHVCREEMLSNIREITFAEHDAYLKAAEEYTDIKDNEDIISSEIDEQ